MFNYKFAGQQHGKREVKYYIYNSITIDIISYQQFSNCFY